MQLRFLGRTYTTSPKQMATVLSIHKACYRVQSYNLPLPVANSNTRTDESLLAASIRKYRGISYVIPHQELPPISDKREVCYR